jgi:UMF1 family MFS transporter
LIADYFFEDAVATVILNIGLYCAVVLQLPEAQISLFLILSTVSAVVGSFLIGKIAQHWSLKNLLTIIMWGWVVSLVLFAFTDNRTVIWILGSLVGILLGGLWTTSRPLLAEMVPREELGRFFGLFALSGRAAAVVGPLVWTAIVLLAQPGSGMNSWFGSISAASETAVPYKLALLSLALMIIVGLVIFRKVPHTRRLTHE